MEFQINVGNGLQEIDVIKIYVRTYAEHLVSIEGLNVLRLFGTFIATVIERNVTHVSTPQFIRHVRESFTS